MPRRYQGPSQNTFHHALVLYRVNATKEVEMIQKLAKPSARPV
jgi:hypothetical protein